MRGIVMKNEFHYNLIFTPEREGGFTVIVPSLAGCVTYGKNLTEAKKRAEDAIEGYIYSLKKHGESVPSDTNSFVATINISAGKRSLKRPVYA